MITTIIFDFSEVCLRGMKGTEERLNIKYGTKLGNPMFMHSKVASKFFRGEISEIKFWEGIIKEFNLKISVAQLRKTVRENFREIEGTRAIIEKLKKNGYRLGLFSNQAREWAIYCEKHYDYHKLFHSRLYSFEISVCKPEKRGYKLIMDKLRVTPEECLFIDDYDVNLVPARELGLATLQFENSEKLRTDLKKLKIKF
jgi:HAD superfamily hydrolase (TIGR01509 family)